MCDCGDVIAGDEPEEPAGADATPTLETRGTRG
jgi:hypothetical protein